MALPRHPAARASTLRAPKVRVVRFFGPAKLGAFILGGGLGIQKRDGLSIIKKKKKNGLTGQTLYILPPRSKRFGKPHRSAGRVW